MKKEKYYEVVGIFNSAQELNETVNELFTHGFEQSSLSVLANEDLVIQNLGKNYRKVDDIADDIQTARTSFYPEENISIAKGAIIGGLMYIGTIATSGIIIIGGGPLSVALTTAAAVAGTTTIIGVLLAKMIGKHHEEYIEKQLQKGGLLLWVHLKDKSQKNLVVKILQDNHARNVHLRFVAKNFYTSFSSSS